MCAGCRAVTLSLGALPLRDHRPLQTPDPRPLQTSWPQRAGEAHLSFPASLPGRVQLERLLTSFQDKLLSLPELTASQPPALLWPHNSEGPRTPGPGTSLVRPFSLAQCRTSTCHMARVPSEMRVGHCPGAHPPGTLLSRWESPNTAEGTRATSSGPHLTHSPSSSSGSSSWRSLAITTST